VSHGLNQQPVLPLNIASMLVERAGQQQPQLCPTAGVSATTDTSAANSAHRPTSVGDATRLPVTIAAGSSMLIVPRLTSMVVMAAFRLSLSCGYSFRRNQAQHARGCT